MQCGHLQSGPQGAFFLQQSAFFLQQSKFFLQQSPGWNSQIPFLEQGEKPALLNANAPMKKPREQAKIIKLAMKVFVEAFIILSPVINS
jgi:hypothetical protein